MQGLFTVVTLVRCGSSDSKLLITTFLELFTITGKFRTSGGHIVQIPPQVVSVMNEIRPGHSGVYRCSALIKYGVCKLKEERN